MVWFLHNHGVRFQIEREMAMHIETVLSLAILIAVPLAVTGLGLFAALCWLVLAVMVAGLLARQLIAPRPQLVRVKQDDVPARIRRDRFV